MYRISVVVLLLVFSLTDVSSQAGLRIYGGLSAQTNESDVITPDGPLVGWHLGGDGRLNSGGMYFVLGGRFTSMAFTNNESIYTGEQPKMIIINTRIGLGGVLFKISEQLKIRGKFLGSINYLSDNPLTVDETNPDFIEYRSVNSTASLIGGIGVSIGPILIDLEYGYGLFNLISNIKDTKPTTLSLSVGTFF